MTTSAKSKRVVLDAGPLMRYLQSVQPGAAEVGELLREAKAGRAEVFMSDVSVAEVGRKPRPLLERQGVDLLLSLRNAGVAIRWASDDVMREVIRTDLALADAYAFATATVTGARLWTTEVGDFRRPDILKGIPITFLPPPRP